jgi:hypothetical protein
MKRQKPARLVRGIGVDSLFKGILISPEAGLRSSLFLCGSKSRCLMLGDFPYSDVSDGR